LIQDNQDMTKALQTRINNGFARLFVKSEWRNLNPRPLPPQGFKLRVFACHPIAVDNVKGFRRGLVGVCVFVHLGCSFLGFLERDSHRICPLPR